MKSLFDFMDILSYMIFPAFKWLAISPEQVSGRCSTLAVVVRQGSKVYFAEEFIGRAAECFAAVSQDIHGPQLLLRQHEDKLRQVDPGLPACV